MTDREGVEPGGQGPTEPQPAFHEAGMAGVPVSVSTSELHRQGQTAGAQEQLEQHGSSAAQPRPLPSQAAPGPLVTPPPAPAAPAPPEQSSAGAGSPPAADSGGIAAAGTAAAAAAGTASTVEEQEDEEAGEPSVATASSSPPGSHDQQQQLERGGRSGSVAGTGGGGAGAGGSGGPHALSPASTAERPAPALADPSAIPVLPDIVRQKDAKRDLPMVCHIEGCGLDLCTQAEYYQRYRICKAHLKAPALMVDGVPQRFCQQCGRFHELSEFDGEKRDAALALPFCVLLLVLFALLNCRARLEQHNSRRRKVFATSQGMRRGGRVGKDRPFQPRLSGELEGEEGGDDGGGEGDPLLMADDRGGLMPTQYSLRGRGTKLAGTRRDRSTIEEEEVLTLTPQEKEAILLLRQAERPLQRQALAPAMPRFLSEPVRGPHGWRAGSGAGPSTLAEEELLLLHPQLQDLLSQQQQVARHEQLSAAAAAGLQAAAAAQGRALTGGPFTSLSSQHSLTARTSVVLPPQYGSGADQRRLEELLGPSGSATAAAAVAAAAAAGPQTAQAPPGNPFAAGAGAAAVLTPSGKRSSWLGALTGCGRFRGYDVSVTDKRFAAADPTASGTAEGARPGSAGSPQQQQLPSQQQQQQHPQHPPPPPAQLPNPFLQQRGGGAPMSSGMSRLGNVAALLGPGSGAGGGSTTPAPKASELLRQMAELAASAELSMEQAALQQAVAGVGGSRPLMEAYPAPFQIAEEIMRRMQQGGTGVAPSPPPSGQAAGYAAAAAAGALPPSKSSLGYRANAGVGGGGDAATAGLGGRAGSGGGAGGGMSRGLTGPDLLAALTGLAPLAAGAPESQPSQPRLTPQQSNQHQQLQLRQKDPAADALALLSPYQGAPWPPGVGQPQSAAAAMQSAASLQASGRGAAAVGGGAASNKLPPAVSAASELEQLLSSSGSSLPPEQLIAALLAGAGSGSQSDGSAGEWYNGSSVPASQPAAGRGAPPALVQDLMTLLQGTMGAAPGSRQDYSQQQPTQQQQPQLQPHQHSHPHARSTGP
ncbi:hypothetical protein N2152v2_006356 [Parachlorella kessleri]